MLPSRIGSSGVMREASHVTAASIGGHLGDFGACDGVGAITTTGTISACHAPGPMEHPASEAAVAASMAALTRDLTII